MDTKKHRERPAHTVPVWDLPLRIFHWSMVGAVFVAGVTGFLASDWWLGLHMVAGYLIAGLLVFRLAWGFFGSHYSRFRSFPLSREGVLHHLIQLLRLKSREYIGHNPVGALMIVVLLLALGALVLTGFVVSGGQEKLGPLAFVTPYKIGHFAEELHEAAAWILVWAIVVHVLGVIVETRFFGHPVISAMITGRKSTTLTGPVREGRWKLMAGLVLSLVVTAVVVGGGILLAGKPALGWKPVSLPKVYARECGDCHDAYHPSLRSAEAWQAIMAGLPDHYGEDASLATGTVATIETFLRANAAAAFDTEVAHRMGSKNTASLRMTDTRRWQKWHRDIDSAVFKLRAVGSKVNCNACHKDALIGRFDDDQIQLPAGDQK